MNDDLHPDMHGGLGLHPAFVARIDQRRAATRVDVLGMVKAFREHVDACNRKDAVICSHAILAVGAYTGRSPLELADLLAMAVSLLVERERAGRDG